MLPPANTGTGTGPSSSPRRSSTAIHGLPDPRLLRERELPLRHLAPAILHGVLRGVVVAAAPTTTTKHAHHHIHLPGPAHVRQLSTVPPTVAPRLAGIRTRGLGRRLRHPLPDRRADAEQFRPPWRGRPGAGAAAVPWGYMIEGRG